MTHQRRLIFLIVTVAASVCGCGGSPPESDPSSSPGPTGTTATEPPVLNFANFIEEIAPDTLANFTRETGIRVNYDTYETNLALESRFPNWRHLDPELLEQLGVNDPGNRHAVPYLWGTTSSSFALMYLGRDPNSERPEDLAAEIRYVIPREGAPAHERMATAFATSSATSAGAWSGAGIGPMRRS
jgi:hypothetical protein